MGVQYGTVNGVKEKAAIFSQDYRQADPVLDQRISDALDQASDIARDLLQSRYALATVDATPPPAVIQFAEIVAALLSISRESLPGGGTDNNSEAYLKQLRMQKKHYMTMIESGNILDSSNNPLSTKPVIQVTASSEISDLEGIYS